MSFKVEQQISCAFQLKMCSILKRILILSTIVQNEMYGQFGYILYLLVQNKVRLNTVSGYDQQFFWGGGVGNISFFTQFFLQQIFFFQIKTSITNTSSSIWLTEIKRPDLQYLYMYNVYLGSLLINAFTVAHCFHLIIPRNI